MPLTPDIVAKVAEAIKDCQGRQADPRATALAALGALTSAELEQLATDAAGHERFPSDGRRLDPYRDDDGATF